MNRRLPFRFWLGVGLLALGAGCVSEEAKRAAISDINADFKAEYEAALAKDGTHFVKASPRESFEAVNASFVKLGLVVTQQSSGLGFISAEAPAPRPLDRSEWDRAAANDLPKARELLRKHIGALADLFHFEPEGLDTVMTATIIGTRGGSEISYTMRMREVAPPTQNLPRREYPPPTALKIGLAKIWASVDQELAARKP
ncbi:MAG TPA: hypothetical protein VF420_03875 [Casimicrobiaceae bacterium]